VALAAQEERDDEVDGGSDESDGGSGDDRDADDSGDDRDADDGDCADDVDDDSSVDDYDSSDDGDGEIADDADDSEVDINAYYSEIVNDADDAEVDIDMDARDAYSEKIRANEEATRVSVDEGADPDEAYAKEHSANFRAYKVYLKANKKHVVKKRWEEIDADEEEQRTDEEEQRKYYEKQEQDKLDSDARIAGNVPSEADRSLLEKLSTYRHAEYAKALRARAARTESEGSYVANYRAYVEASDTFIREHEELNAQAKKECSAREANGEDARDVRTRWEQFERYSCLGALDDAFFDPRNG
jgi:hypothetical protein